MAEKRKQPKGSSYAPFGSDKPRDRTYYGDTGPEKTQRKNDDDDPPNYGSEYDVGESIESPKRGP